MACERSGEGGPKEGDRRDVVYAVDASKAADWSLGDGTGEGAEEGAILRTVEGAAGQQQHEQHEQRPVSAR